VNVFISARVNSTAVASGISLTIATSNFANRRRRAATALARFDVSALAFETKNSIHRRAPDFEQRRGFFVRASFRANRERRAPNFCRDAHVVATDHTRRIGSSGFCVTLTVS
jgi:hypothetical protein